MVHRSMVHERGHEQTHSQCVCPGIGRSGGRIKEIICLLNRPIAALRHRLFEATHLHDPSSLAATERIANKVQRSIFLSIAAVYSKMEEPEPNGKWIKSSYMWIWMHSSLL